MVAHILWSPSSTNPIICTRITWKSCPKHKFLSDKISDRKPSTALKIEEPKNSETYSASEYMQQNI